MAIQSFITLAFEAGPASLVGVFSDRIKHSNGLMVAAVSVAVPAWLMGAASLRSCERSFEGTVGAAKAAEARRFAKEDAG